MRTIIGPQGIGDVAWIFQKLINQKEKFNWIFPLTDPTSEVQKRASQLEILLPDLINSVQYGRMKFERDIRPNGYKGNWDNTPGKEFTLEANSWLEAGNRIEKFLPDLETSFILPFKTSSRNKREAAEILEPFKDPDTNEGHKVCGIYTSNHASIKDAWMAPEWIELMRLIKKFDPNYRFVLIGAPYDYTEGSILKRIEPAFEDWDFVKCIGRELGTTIEILKRLDIFISFQSGLSIINELIGAPMTTMLYWNDRKHRNIIESWPDPERMYKSLKYKGCVFCEPVKIFDWLCDNGKL